MTEYEKKLQELKAVMNLTDPESTEKKETLLRWLEANSDNDTNQASLDAFIENGIAEEKKGDFDYPKQTGSIRLT